MTVEHNIPKVIDMDAGRRAFIRSVGLATASAAVLGGVTLRSDEASAQALTDVNILNFALNLEYLEAEFYLRAAFGRGLEPGDTTGTGTRGSVVGGRKVPFGDDTFAQQLAEEIADDEEAHVKFLRSALGGQAVARPRLDLDTAFTKAARAAGLIGASQEFDAYANADNFLIAAYIFEDVGVTAYKGAARFITNKDYLEAAAGILAVEAYHAAGIREQLFLRRLFKQAAGISNLRDKADRSGGENKDEGITRNGNKLNLVPTDPNGIAFSRTPDQVLGIVYLGGASAAYGFFPGRLNGALR
jgi:hypothetical protein